MGLGMCVSASGGILMLEDLDVGIDLGILWLAPVPIHLHCSFASVYSSSILSDCIVCLCTYTIYVGMTNSVDDDSNHREVVVYNRSCVDITNHPGNPLYRCHTSK